MLWPNPKDDEIWSVAGGQNGTPFERNQFLPHFNIHLPIEQTWVPEWETDRAFEARVLADAQQELDRILGEIKSKLDQAGVQKPAKLKCDRFEWLARHLVGRQSARKIAKAAYPNHDEEETHSNVSRGIRDAAQALALPTYLDSALPSVIAAATAIAAAVDVAVASRLKIQSPSKVMMDHSANVVEGFMIPLRRGVLDAGNLIGGIGVPRGIGLSSGRTINQYVTVVIDPGSFLNGDAVREIKDQAAIGALQVVDRRVGRARIAES